MITKLMASAIYSPSGLSSSSSSSTIRKSTILSTSISLNPNSVYSSLILTPNLLHFAQWNGLKQLGISISRQSVKQESKGNCKRKCKGVVFASLFGVGAPEALVIGVVALLVFGPKGLAEVARNLGKTLREFQPTIRELQQVSNEFKSTLEREIGLDEVPTPKRDPFNSNPPPNVTPNPPPQNPTDESNGSSFSDKAYSTEDYLKITEEQLKAAASQQEQEQEQKDQTTTSVGQVPLESSSQPQDTVEEAAESIPTPQKSESET